MNEPTIADAQAALDRVRRTLVVPFETVNSVARFPGHASDYDVHFLHGPALTVVWPTGGESFEDAVYGALLRYFQSDGSERLANHQSS